MKYVTTKMFAAACGLAMSAGLAMAGPADDSVNGRQGCMKANGAAMGALVPVVKGEAAFDKAVLDAAVAKVEAACAGWGNWWSADHKQGETVKSYAKEAIWTDNATFQTAGATFVTALGGLKAATDDATFKAAFGPFGGACQGCHEKFRAPKE